MASSTKDDLTTTTNIDHATATSIERHNPFLTSLIAGGLAGTSVDVALFPIDTLKTRLQSPHGFFASGGFQNVYRGFWAAAFGSAPGAALFFGTYETMKPIIGNWQQEIFKSSSSSSGLSYQLATSPALTHMTSASIGEAMACLVRVPTEVLKSKMQTNAIGTSTLSSTLQLVLSEKDGRAFASNVFGGLYRGYGITLLREVPFAFIQFPLYEKLKVLVGEYQGYTTSPLQAAACGSISGGIAAGLTTPLDVIKTRLMLGSDRLGVPYHGVKDVVQRLMQEESSGSSIFFRGVQPRVMWISIGGFVFFGAYETFRTCLMALDE
ncbi:hypothetical protein ACHAXH_003483 [Discostella pseudostelligera]